MRAFAIQQALLSLGEVQSFIVPVAEPGPSGSRVVSPVRGACSWLAYQRGRALLEVAPLLPVRARNATPAHGENILQQISGQHFDLVYILRLYMAGTALPLMRQFQSTRFLLDVDEDDHAVMRQIALLQQAQGDTALAEQSYSEAGRLQAFAQQALPWFEIIASASPDEAASLQHVFGVSAVSLPNVITPTARDPVLKHGTGFKLLFLGNLDYWPNRDALSWLLTELFPAVLKAIPQAELIVAGHGAVDLKSLHGSDQSIRWLGFVDDLSAVYSQANVCVVPLRAGGGSRLKILEAFNHSVPVVASRKAVEGLAVVHGRQVLLGENPEEFVQAIMHIANDPLMASELANYARQHVCQHHSPVNLELKIRKLLC